MDSKELIKLIASDAEIGEEQAEYALTSFCTHIAEAGDDVDITNLFEEEEE